MAKKDNKKKKIKRLSKSDVKTTIIKLEDLEKLSVEDQEKLFEDTFDKIYSGEEIESLRKYSLRCIKLTCDPKDNKIHLPYGVLVQKKGNEIIIKVYQNRHWFLIMLFLTLLALAIVGASYSAVNYKIIQNLNKDIDGDGIPDINLDLNNDRVAEVNIDTNNDDKPDVNIDYKGNRKATFNIDTDNDGIPDFNLMNQDTDNDGVCDINCDINGDGWPDINLDLDGDGKVDMEIDTDKDKRADLNFDMNGDGICDLHCDTTGDLKCDKYCLKSEDLENVDPSNSGSSKNVGNKDYSVKAGELVLEYEDDNTVFIENIYPDDQPYYNGKVPPKRFKITNKSSIFIKYNLKWIITENNYLTDNFKYSITSTNNGVNFDFKTAPKEDSVIATSIIIPPNTTQDYEMNFKLQGTGGKQNEDQNKTFAGHVEVYLDNEY